jgi:hypothetical protein
MQTTIKTVKTNSKEVKTAVQKYIIDCIDTSDFEGHIEGDTKNDLQIIADEFKRVALYPNNLRNLGSYQACFIDWLQGLPSCINIDYMTYRQLEILESLGLPLPANKDKMDGVNLFYYLIFREFSALCRKYKVSFCI